MRIKKRWRWYFLDTSKTTPSFQGAVFSSEIGKKIDLICRIDAYLTDLSEAVSLSSKTISSHFEMSIFLAKVELGVSRLLSLKNILIRLQEITIDS